MPDFVEPLVTALVDYLSSSPQPEHRQLLSITPPSISPIFAWYARKLAGRAVRNRSQKDLLRGLVALAISTCSGDFSAHSLFSRAFRPRVCSA
jgi:hypothetical protein